MDASISRPGKADIPSFPAFLISSMDVGAVGSSRSHSVGSQWLHPWLGMKRPVDNLAETGNPHLPWAAVGNEFQTSRMSICNSAKTRRGEGATLGLHFREVRSHFNKKPGLAPSSGSEFPVDALQICGGSPLLACLTPMRGDDRTADGVPSRPTGGRPPAIRR